MDAWRDTWLLQKLALRETRLPAVYLVLLLSDLAIVCVDYALISED